MSLERAFGESQGVFQKRIDITATKELAVHEQIVVVGTTTGNITITLPAVGEAIGKLFSIHAPTIGTDTNTITLEDKNNDSIDWGGDYTLAADNDRILLFSDGRVWWVLDNQIA